MKKKIAAFVLASALVLPLSVPAFAATPSDVVGKPVQSAVEELTALGIIKGYEDGTFKPDNQITRAELAKVIVIASGNESAATLMANVKPAFKDVKASQWYTGYINAAAAKGFILGYNGNFRPSDSVKFEEVVAILVRALGYKESKLTGAWPYNYLIAGTDIELFEGVDVTPGTLANRGIVAKLTSNTINTETVTYNATTGDIQKGAKLISKIGVTSSDVLVKPTLAGDDKLIGLAAAGPVKTASNFIVTGGKSLVDLLGHEVTVIKNKSGQVLAVTDAQDGGKVVTGTADGDAGASAESVQNITPGATDAVTIKVGSDYKKYSTATAVTYYENYVDKSGAVYGLKDGLETTVVLDSANKVRFVIATKWDGNAVFSKYDAATSYRDARVTFKDNTSVDVVASTKISINGAAAVATDLKENDVIRYIKTSNSDASIIEVTRKAVTGKVESKRSSGNDVFYTIAGAEYKALAAVALNFNQEYTVYLNKDNVIVTSTSPNAATSTGYVVVMKDAVDGKFIIENGGPSDTIYTYLNYYSLKEGKTITAYPKTTVVTEASAKKGDIVELTFDANGNITGISAAAKIANKQVAKDVSATSVTVGNSTYFINSNTVVIDATGFANDVVSIADLAKLTNGDEIVISSKNGINASAITIVSDAGATSGAVYGLYVSKAANESATGAKTYTVTLNVGGVNTPFTISATNYDALATTTEREIVKIDGTTLSEVSGIVADTAAKLPALTNDQINNALFTTNVSGALQWYVSGKTVVYVVDKNNNVAIGDYTDVKDAADAVNNANVEVKPSLTVVQNGTNKVGSFNDAAVIIVKKNA